MVFCGCPYSSVYKIDAEPQNQVDESYLGKWMGIISPGEGIRSKRVVRMALSRKTDFEYDILFTGHFDELKKYNLAKNDTIRATGFMSYVDGRMFLNARVADQNFITVFQYENDKISILPLNEHFTNRIIKSNEELRRSLLLHFKTRLYPLFDDQFCLREMTREN
jgi:hypothetical protein